MTGRTFVCIAAMETAGGMALSAQAETLVWNGARGSALTAAGAVTLPASLTVTAIPTTAGVQLSTRVPLVTAGTTLSGPADFSGWSVVDADGNAIRGAQLSYGADGKSVWLFRSVGTFLFFRQQGT